MGLMGWLTKLGKKDAKKMHAKSERAAQALRPATQDVLPPDPLQDSLEPKTENQPPPNYTLTGNLGKGSLGKVDRYDAPGQTPIAKKTAFSGGEEELKKEHEVLDLLGDHDHIVKKAKGMETAENEMALELLQGGNMQDMMDGLEKDYKDGKINHTQYWGSIQHLTKGTLKGVQHMNEKGMVHGDLKPGNVMIDEKTAQPKLIDFGSATEIGEKAPRGQTPVINTAPETTNGEHKVHATNDVYAVGNIAYRMGEGSKDESYAHMDPQYKGGVSAYSGRSKANKSGEMAIKDPEKKGAYGEFVNALTNPNPDARPTAEQSLEAPFLQDSLMQEHEAQAFLKARIGAKNGAPVPPPLPDPKLAELSTTTATRQDHKAKSDMQKELLKATKGTRKELDADASERSKTVKKAVKEEKKTKKRAVRQARSTTQPETDDSASTDA